MPSRGPALRRASLKDLRALLPRWQTHPRLRPRRAASAAEGQAVSTGWRPLLRACLASVIRTEEMAADRLPTSAARGIRILYSSTSGVGDPVPIFVSGQLLLPKPAAPAGGWPVVAWEHGTTGIAAVCAPSLRGWSSRDRAYSNHWLDEGFAVVATDYQGLGTPGPHPYLHVQTGRLQRPGRRPSGVASTFGDMLRNQIVLVGQSQGSGAALGAAWLAPRYSPELHIIGAVATGLVVEFATKAEYRPPPLPVSFDDPAEMDAAYAMLRVEGTDQSLHPEINRVAS